MRVPKIFINPGHRNGDPGAVGYEVEHDLNVKVSEHQRKYLEAHYVCEVRVRDGYINDVVAEANAWGADLFVSNHFNAGGGDGYEALVFSEKRRGLGEVFERHVKAAGQNSRGVKLRPDLGVLCFTDAPAVLNEGAFVDNYDDIKDWNDDSELQVLGKAYALATAEYLGLQEKSVAPAYTRVEFVKDVQRATGAAVDGIVGPETMGKTVTLSASCNATHAVVAPVQRRLAALGYSQVGEVDGIAGPKFTAAVRAYQSDRGGIVDGEITAGLTTWRKLLTED